VTYLIQARPNKSFTEANYCFVSCGPLGEDRKKPFQIRTHSGNRLLTQHSFLPFNAGSKPVQTIGWRIYKILEENKLSDTFTSGCLDCLL